MTNGNSISISSFVGQTRILRGIRAQIEMAVENNESLGHILLTGPLEMGKATLARAAADAMNTNRKEVRAGSLENKAGGLAAIVTNLQPGDILIIEDLDLLKKNLVELLIPALENFTLDIIIGKGPSARSIKLSLRPFTVIGISSKPSQIDNRLVRQFIVYDFEPYSKNEISQIVRLLAKRSEYEIGDEESHLIARHSGGSPGNAEKIVRRVGRRCTSLESTKEALEIIGYTNQTPSSVEIARYINGLSGKDFEEYVAKIFLKMGYKVELVGAAGDHGIDLTVERGTERIVIQCKRWSDPVGEPVVRDFYGSLLHAGEKLGCIIATTTFTSQAISFAQGKPIKLLDFDNFIRLVLQQNDDRS